jgi:hypothetical protein
MLRDSSLSRWFPIVLAVLGFSVISPALWSGWLGDDAFYSVLNGVLKADGLSLWQAMWRSFEQWLLGNGRFYPGLVIEKYLVFYIFTNLVAYKAFLVAMTLVTVELFRRCVTGYTNAATANLCALIVITLFTERGYHDSILAYNAMPQVVMVAMLASLMTFRRALVERSIAMRIASIVFFAIAAITYEDVYLLCLIYPAIVALARRARAEVVRMSWPYVLISAFLTILALAMRHVVGLPKGSNYAIGPDPLAIARTAGDQIVSAFPLSYWAFDPSGIYSRSDVNDFFRNAPLSPIVFVAFAIAAWWCLRQVVRNNSARVAPLVWIGLLVLVLPALPIAVTVKYQHELKLGLGYLPVFFQIFGVALIGAALAKVILLRWRVMPAQIVLCGAIAMCATMTQATNLRLVREGEPSRYARSALEEQLIHGLVSDIRDGASIEVAQHFDWIAYDDDGPDAISTRGLFALYANRRITLVPIGDARAQFTLVYHPERNTWTIASRSPRRP